VLRQQCQFSVSTAHCVSRFAALSLWFALPDKRARRPFVRSNIFFRSSSMRCKLTCRGGGFFLGGIWVIGKDMGWVKVVIKYYIGIEKRNRRRISSWNKRFWTFKNVRVLLRQYVENLAPNVLSCIQWHSNHTPTTTILAFHCRVINP
jgi:hypothetical protein